MTMNHAVHGARLRAVTPDEAPSERSSGTSWFTLLGEKIANRVLPGYLAQLVAKRGDVQRELRSIPQRIQRLANQAALAIELLDDFRVGRYRALALRNLAVGAGALLYAVSPSDVVPDFVPAVGALDDALVLGIAMRLMKRDLVRYCEFKGYDPAQYFA